MDIVSGQRIALSPVAPVVDGAANYLIFALATMLQGTTPPLCATYVTREAPMALATGVSPTSQARYVDVSNGAADERATVGLAGLER